MLTYKVIFVGRWSEMQGSEYEKIRIDIRIKSADAEHAIILARKALPTHVSQSWTCVEVDYASY